MQRVSSCTIGLLFLGTPNHGADLAEWATLGTTIAKIVRHTNSDIVSVLTPGSKMLSRVQHGFHSFLRLRTEIAIMCFFEELPLHTVGKVRSVDLVPVRLLIISRSLKKNQPSSQDFRMREYLLIIWCVHCVHHESTD